MIGTRYVTTAALALGTVLLATTALQGASAQVRGEGLPAGAGINAGPSLTEPAEAADLNEAEPARRTAPFVPGSNPDGGKRPRFTGQPSPTPYPTNTGAPPPRTAKQPTAYPSQRYSGGIPSPTAADKPSPGTPYASNSTSGYVPPSASKQPALAAPGGYHSGPQGDVNTAPYKQPYGAYADYNGYRQGGYGGYQGGYGESQGGYGGYQGAYGSHHHDCP